MLLVHACPSHLHFYAHILDPRENSHCLATIGQRMPKYHQVNVMKKAEDRCFKVYCNAASPDIVSMQWQEIILQI